MKKGSSGIIVSDADWKKADELIEGLTKKSSNSERVDPEKLRSDLKELGYKLILGDPQGANKREFDKKYWLCVFYGPIAECRKQKGIASKPEYARLLNGGVGTFSAILDQLYYNGECSSVLRSVLSVLGHAPRQPKCEEKTANRLLVYRLLLCLADLMRYAAVLPVYNDPQAKTSQKLYQLAIELAPEQGQAYNQLAVITSRDERCILERLYYYLAALGVTEPFTGLALKNLQDWFEKGVKTDDPVSDALIKLTRSLLPIFPFEKHQTPAASAYVESRVPSDSEWLALESRQWVYTACIIRFLYQLTPFDLSDWAVAMAEVAFSSPQHFHDGHLVAIGVLLSPFGAQISPVLQRCKSPEESHNFPPDFDYRLVLKPFYPELPSGFLPDAFFSEQFLETQPTELDGEKDAEDIVARLEEGELTCDEEDATVFPVEKAVPKSEQNAVDPIMLLLQSSLEPKKTSTAALESTLKSAFEPTLFKQPTTTKQQQPPASQPVAAKKVDLDALFRPASTQPGSPQERLPRLPSMGSVFGPISQPQPTVDVFSKNSVDDFFNRAASMTATNSKPTANTIEFEKIVLPEVEIPLGLNSRFIPVAMLEEPRIIEGLGKIFFASVQL